jgi:hypothetical protein
MLKNKARMTILLSALVGLVFASFGTVPLANASDVSKMGSQGGAGYVGIISPGEITHLTAEWNQPAVTCQPSLAEQSEFANLGIANSSTEFFLATVGDCAQGSLTPTYFAAAVYVLTGANIPLNFVVLTLAVNPGDAFSASINLSPSTHILTANMTDVSTSQSASATFTQASFPVMPTVVAWDVAGSSFTQFSVPIRFSNCTATVSGQTFTISKIETLVRFTKVDAAGNTMATTSSLSRAGSSFKVTWVSST